MATGELALPADCLDEPIPNTPITIVDGNMHSFALSFSDFLKIRLTFAIFLNGNVAFDYGARVCSHSERLCIVLMC